MFLFRVPINNLFAQRHQMNFVWAVPLTTPARVIESLGHAVILGEAACTVHLHTAVDNVLRHNWHRGLTGGDEV